MRLVPDDRAVKVPPGLEAKRCFLCEQTRPIDCFRLSRMSSDGLSDRCKACSRRTGPSWESYIDPEASAHDRSGYDLELWRETRAVTDEEWGLIRAVAARVILFRRWLQRKPPEERNPTKRPSPPARVLDEAGVEQGRQTALLDGAHQLAERIVGRDFLMRAPDERWGGG